MTEGKVGAGNTIRFFCETTLDDGTPVQKSEKPISKRIGTGDLIRCLDNAIIGMTPGQVKTFRATPEEAF